MISINDSRIFYYSKPLVLLFRVYNQPYLSASINDCGIVRLYIFASGIFKFFLAVNHDVSYHELYETLMKRSFPIAK